MLIYYFFLITKSTEALKSNKLRFIDERNSQFVSRISAEEIKTMNESTMTNVATTQRRRYYIGISMNESIIENVATTQCHRYYVGVPMNESTMVNVITTQLGTSCSFDSPGLARDEPTLGKHSQGDSTP